METEKKLLKATLLNAVVVDVGSNVAGVEPHVDLRCPENWTCWNEELLPWNRCLKMPIMTCPYRNRLVVNAINS